MQNKGNLEGLEPIEQIDAAGLISSPRTTETGLRINIRGRSIRLRRLHRPPKGVLRWLLILGPV